MEDALSRARVVAEARRWLATPYAHQASLLGVGCDCLGLVRGVWRSLVGPEPEALRPYTREWAELDAGEPLLEVARRHLVHEARNRLEAGDVVIFRPRLHGPAKHVAILSSPDRMIHAQEGHCVAEVALGPWWRRRIAGLFSLPGLTDL
ncbi:MAG: peptidase P60 [Rhizobiales bacterium]|nr:peptidase P60 [Hyphomicrobiales bacterium]